MSLIDNTARRASAMAAAALLFALAACSDGLPTEAPQPPEPAPPAGTVASIPCTASVAARTLVCVGTVGTTARGIRGDRVIGGQGTYLKLTSSNVKYDTATQTLSADLTVQNLMPQRMGSDGVTVSGTRVFFNSLPAVNQGTGEVTVDNPAGLDAFTGSLQPYFQYSGALAPNETSAPQRWRFHVPLSAVSFSFTLYVSTQLVPAIVFEMAPSGNRDLYRMGIDGNDLLRLTTNGAKDSNPTVSQGKVVFVSYRDGNAELYSIPLHGGTETRLTSTAGAETSPALSPDGTRLAWTRADPGQLYKLWSGNASADSAKAVIGTTGDAIESTPSWASSTVLAYGSTMISSNDIFRVTVGGGAPTVLAASDQADVEPAWSPDGKQLAFASNRTRDTELYLLTVSSNTLTRLTTRTGSDGAPTWLSDGRIVYTCVQGTTLKLCILDPSNPSAASIIPTPYAADHAAGVRF